MAKVTLNDISNTEASSIIAAFNVNNALVEAAFENTFSRDGTSPNTLGADLDLNSHFIINLPTPTDNSHATNKSYVDGLVSSLNADALAAAVNAASEADTARDAAQTAQGLAETARDAAQGYAEDAASYVGAAISAQTLTTPRTFSFTGNVTGGPTSFDGSANVSTALTISDSSVTNAMLSNMSANTIKGRAGSTGAPQDLNGTSVAALLPVFGTGGATLGVVSNSGSSNTSQYLRRDGSWASPPSATVPSSGSYGSGNSGTQISTTIGDMILKMGQAQTLSTSEGITYVYFTNPFPTACINIQLTGHNPGAVNNEDEVFQLINRNQYYFSLYMQRMSGAGAYTGYIDWIAWGY